MSDIFEDDFLNTDFKSWTIDDLYNEWTITNYELKHCDSDSEFADRNLEDICNYRNKIEYELDVKGFDWKVS